MGRSSLSPEERSYTAGLIRTMRANGVSIHLARDGELTAMLAREPLSNQIDFLKSRDNAIYGWFDKGQIFLTEEGINPNTPLHEYTHAFMLALRNEDPKRYEGIVRDLRHTETWQDVLHDEAYAEIVKNEPRLASEVAARIVGDESERMAGEGLADKVLRAIRDFFDFVREKLGIEDNDALSPRRLANMVMKDVYSFSRHYDGDFLGMTDRRLEEDVNSDRVGNVPRVLFDIIRENYGERKALQFARRMPEVHAEVFWGRVSGLKVQDGYDRSYPSAANYILQALIEPKIDSIDLSRYAKAEMMVTKSNIMNNNKNMANKNYTQNADGKSAEDRALDKFAELMISKVETLQGDWKKPWFTPGAAQPPKNLAGRSYNGMNSIILMLQQEKNGWATNRYATFDRITALNYEKNKDGARVPAVDKDGNKLPLVSVNKGEKSTPVFLTVFNVVNRESKERINYDDYRRLSEEERAKYNIYPKLQVYNVFNLDQTNLKESRPEMYERLSNETKGEIRQSDEGMAEFPAIDAMIEKNLWYCPIKPTMGDDAYFSISRDEIVIPEKKQFVDGESFYSNLLHEMAHSTGAEGRLGRLQPSKFASDAYCREELVAELTAALVSSQHGMAKHVKSDSAAYIKNWLDALKTSPDFLKTTLMDVKKASTVINTRIDAVNQKLEQGEGADYSDIREQNRNFSASFSQNRTVKPQNDVQVSAGQEEQAQPEVKEQVEVNAARCTVQSRFHR